MLKKVVLGSLCAVLVGLVYFQLTYTNNDDVNMEIYNQAVAQGYEFFITVDGEFYNTENQKLMGHVNNGEVFNNKGIKFGDLTTTGAFVLVNTGQVYPNSFYVDGYFNALGITKE